MRGLRAKRRVRPELPLVPLIDVLVMLVLFSFVTMRFASTQTIRKRVTGSRSSTLFDQPR